MPITKRQKETLDFVRVFREKKGYAPSLEEIKKHLGLSSVSTAHHHVKALMDAGYLGKEENQPRAINIYQSERMVQVPLLGMIAAGQPIEAIEQKEIITVPRNRLSRSPQNIYALKVVGNSMIDENINDGDIVLVRYQSTADDGEKIVALIDNHEATLKTFFREKGQIRLQPANKKMEPIIIRNGERGFAIQGIVIDVIKTESEVLPSDIVSQEEVNKDRNQPPRPKELKYVTDGATTVFNGDCINVLKSIKGESIDLIFADPPYNLGKDFGNDSDKWVSSIKYLEWCEKWIDECVRVLKPDGTFYLMNSTQNMPHLDIYVGSKMKIINRIVWQYDSSGVQAKNKFGSLYEPIIMAVKNDKNYKFNYQDIQVEAKTGAQRKLIDYRKETPTPYNTKKTPGNVWYFPRVRYRMSEYEDHPSQKPETLMRRIILTSSNRGDTILDPFAGTFTTCAVAKNYKRKTIGIEINEEYFKIGLRRLALADEYEGKVLAKNLSKKTKNKNKRDHLNNQRLPSLFSS